MQHSRSYCTPFLIINPEHYVLSTTVRHSLKPLVLNIYNTPSTIFPLLVQFNNVRNMTSGNHFMHFLWMLSSVKCAHTHLLIVNPLPESVRFMWPNLSDTSPNLSLLPVDLYWSKWISLFFLLTSLFDIMPWWWNCFVQKEMVKLQE